MNDKQEFATKLLAEGNFHDTVLRLMQREVGETKVEPPFARLWDVARTRALFFPASTRHHGVWVGGLNDHMNDILVYMWLMRDQYHNDLTVTEMAVLALLHDWEKLWKYSLKEVKSADGSTSWFKGDQWTYSKVRPTVSHSLRIGAFLHYSGLAGHEYILNALTMSEGGWSVESKAGNHTESLPVAALLHAADMFSAKVRGDKPSIWAMTQEEIQYIRYEERRDYLFKAQRKVETDSPIEKVLWPD